VRGELARVPGIHEVLFCCFSAGDAAIYQELLG
jgi:hypothetical protein